MQVICSVLWVTDMGTFGPGNHSWRNLWWNLYPYGISSSGNHLFHFCRRFVYHELDLKSILEAFKETALINGQTTFLVGISMAFARFLTMSQVPGTLAKGILGISNPIAILLVINLFLLVVGCFIDNISSTVILTPILLPIVAGIGMSPIQFGIVMTVNLAIGFITPPYGCNLFFASAISNVSVVDIAKKILPMIGVMLIVLMALTFIPALSIGILDFL